jgi:hypothetical protein
MEMPTLSKWILVILLLRTALPLVAEVELAREAGRQLVFSGARRGIQIILENRGASNSVMALSAQLFQTTSATAAAMGGPAHWENVEVLAGQRILATRSFDFPEVKAATRFVIRWLAETNRVLGKTEVMVFPTNLLADLRPYAKGGAIGLFDPDDNATTLLKNVPLEVEDVMQRGIEAFNGKLAIVWGGSESTASELKNKVEKFKCKAVVWVVATPESGLKAEPGMYLVRRNGGTVVVLQSRLVADLRTDPQAQLNLLRAVRLAVKPELLDLPGKNNELN